MIKSVTQAYFITVDGPDGSGKSTICKHIKNHLNDRFDLTAFISSGLGGSSAGSAIRCRILDDTQPKLTDLEVLGIPFSFIDTAHHKVIPSLADDVSVIMDRWVSTYYAYQVSGRGCQSARDIFENILIKNLHSQLVPNISFICNVDIDVAEARIQDRGDTNHLDRESRAFKERVIAGYKQFTDRFFNQVIVLDCNKPLEEVIKTVNNHLEMRI